MKRGASHEAPKAITQREVAKRARTSLKTVSRVINRDPLVNAETRTKIEAVIAEMGYTPSQAARMMRSQQSNIIGFLAYDVATTYTSVDLIRGAQDVAWERGKQMMLLNIEQEGPSAELAENQLTAFRAEAVIYAATHHRSVDVDPSTLPHVLLNCFDAKKRYPSVVPDDYQLAFEVTSIIYDKGYRRPVFLNLLADSVATELRRKGFVDSAAKRGFDVSGDVHTALVHDPALARTRYVADEILPKLMSGRHRPDVVLCGHDPMAMAVYFVLNDLGLKVGQDIGVVSFDDQRPIVNLLKPGLSTMALPYYEMGRAAMTMAIDGVAGRASLRLPGNFVDRESLPKRKTR